MGERRRRSSLCAVLPILVLAACGSEPRDDLPGAEGTAFPANGGAGEFSSFARWDQDVDQHLDPGEFTLWAQDESIFADWMGEQGVEMAVLHEHLQVALDANADGDIDESDWSAGVQRLFGDADPGPWSGWDADDDGELDGAEFMQAAEDRGLHARIDRNGDSVVTEQELRDFYFTVFDRNGDGLLDSNEWNQGRATWLGHEDA